MRGKTYCAPPEFAGFAPSDLRVSTAISGGTRFVALDGFTIGLTTGLLSKKLLFIIPQPVNQTDRQINVWMVVRLDDSDRRMPI